MLARAGGKQAAGKGRLGRRGTGRQAGPGAVGGSGREPGWSEWRSELGRACAAALGCLKWRWWTLAWGGSGRWAEGGAGHAGLMGWKQEGRAGLFAGERAGLGLRDRPREIEGERGAGWAAKRVWAGFWVHYFLYFQTSFPFLILTLFPISISNSNSSQMNSNLNLNSL